MSKFIELNGETYKRIDDIEGEEDYIHKDYILGPGDRLEIKNNKEIKMNVEVVINPEEIEETEDKKEDLETIYKPK